MGFRTGTYAKIWDVQPKTDTITRCRISTSRKDKNLGKYVQDFGGYVAFVGTTAASQAAKLKEGDRIKLGDVDVTNRYDAEKKTTYTNFNVYSFETDFQTAQTSAQASVEAAAEPEPVDLPF